MTAPTFGGAPPVDERRESGQLWDDFVAFSRAQLACQDVDPAYPVLRKLQEEMSHEQALWHSILYVAYYNIASAQEAFAWVNWPGIVPDDISTLPTGIERRGLRGGAALNRHLASVAQLVEKYGGSLQGWLDPWLNGDRPVTMKQRQAAYRIIRDDKLREPWGNGRWAAYKTAEILEKVNGLPLTATDMGNDDSSGPRRGLELLYGKLPGNSAAVIAQLDEWGEQVQARLNAEPGIPIPVTIDEIETLLCDFHALAAGHYYVGHDIDQMYAQLTNSKAQQYMGPVWKARQQVFPQAYLAEVTSHAVLDGGRKRAYRDLGMVLTREGKAEE